MLPLFACAAFEVAWIELAIYLPNPQLAFRHRSLQLGLHGCSVVLSSVMCVAMAIKIWNNTRIEMNLEQNQQLLLKARMDALTSQINPHFLFNTLNTVSSLIRFDPDMARGVVLKLSNILRRLLRKHETFVPAARRAGFHRRLLGYRSHPLRPRQAANLQGNGRRHARRLRPQHAAAADDRKFHQARPCAAPRRRPDSPPLASPRWPPLHRDRGQRHRHFARAPREVYGGGIGISNVHERLRLLYGDQFKMDIQSHEGQGTQIYIEIPEVSAAEPAAN